VRAATCNTPSERRARSDAPYQPTQFVDLWPHCPTTGSPPGEEKALAHSFDNLHRSEQSSVGAAPEMIAVVSPLQGLVPSKRDGYKHGAPLELNSDIKSLTNGAGVRASVNSASHKTIEEAKL